ncbi:MAG: DUF5060 domain-containing protein [Bryobacteraceae bacterium]
MRKHVFVSASLLAVLTLPCGAQEAVSGERKVWHRVTLTFDGPSASEDGDPNPFRDYRLNVTFRPAGGGRAYTVPGYFAADGIAAETSAKAGDKWRVHFAPDQEGEWRYEVSFRTGTDVAMSLEPNAGTPAAFDGATGSFRVARSDKQGADFRAKGMLRYIGGFHLRHAGNGEYFLKGGADSPENFLAYADFDDTWDADADSGSYKAVGTFIHTYEPHLKDWRRGDPTWKGGKGKGIIGALNYLASKGMNSVYFLTYNLDGGDGRDTWMWTSPKIRDRYDVSKLDQWEIVFTHMDRLGIMLHVVTQETENDRALGGGPGLNPIRKLYYRELVARLGHHPALIWNLGEENNTSDADRIEIARYIRTLDAYEHPITVHTHNNKAPDFYNGILGSSYFEATSIQSAMDRYYGDAVVLRERSAKAGRKWAIFGDEQAPASHGVLPDAEDPNHDGPRKQALWGNLMGGGSGVEWYFGHKFPHMDINCEDWRSRDGMWDQTRHALEFFRRHLPFWEMDPDKDSSAGNRMWVLAKPGAVYAVYLPNGGTAALSLPEGNYDVRWYNPRTGGSLQNGTIRTVKGPGAADLGAPPADPESDWAVLVRRK